MGSLQGYVGLQNRLHAVGNATRSGQLLGKLATAAVAQQKALAPKKTANLARSIHVGAVTPTVAATVASANYARYVEFGTKAHEIRPKPGRIGRNGRPAALAWGGARRLTGSLRSGASPTMFARVVHHPGTRAHPFMVPGAKAAVAASPLRDLVVAAWNEAA